jgi:S-adenosylmethionine:tRNA ribosyltransferase-isomerase
VAAGDSPNCTFDYVLPVSAIAQVPLEPRDAARLLDATDPAGTVRHRRVHDLPALVGPGDVVVLNRTRVLPARLRLRKPTGGHAEVLLLEPLPASETGPDLGKHALAGAPAPAGLLGGWRALVRPGRRLPPGTTLLSQRDHSGAAVPVVRIGDRLPGGCRAVEVLADPHRFGVVPLPPYIHTPLADPERYQTVYATTPGSVAAPTAGLHLTEPLLAACVAAGAVLAYVELDVGLDTFRPIEGDPDDHVMHSERYRIPPETWEACRTATRVVAVGTTSVRALETAGRTGALAGRTDLFIRGAFPFAVVDLLLTNFHMPRSSLLLLVEAFCGTRWRDLYATALAEHYRFLSFGDAMIVTRA